MCSGQHVRAFKSRTVPGAWEGCKILLVGEVRLDVAVRREQREGAEGGWEEGKVGRREGAEGGSRGSKGREQREEVDVVLEEEQSVQIHRSSLCVLCRFMSPVHVCREILKSRTTA